LSYQRLKQLERGEFSQMRLGLAHLKDIVNYILKDATYNHNPTKIIVVAGSNGKGSCVAFSETLLLQRNLKVGTFTSPHLIDLKERIRIGGRVVTHKFLLQSIDYIDKIAMQFGVLEQLTFFEYLFIIALGCFKVEKIDYYLIEVGIGGRLDATNTLPIDISMFTTISLEHTQILGDTIDAIAKEKAGIARPNKPAIMTFPIAALEKHIQQIGGNIVKAYSNSSIAQCEQEQKIDYHYYCSATELVKQLGYQQNISYSRASALVNKQLIGRLQQFKVNSNRVLVDVAHNPESIDRLAQFLATKKQQWQLVCGFSKVDYVDYCFEKLNPYCKTWYFVENIHPRLVSSNQIKQQMLHLKNFKVIASEQQLLDIFIQDEQNILVMGSFYIVGPTLQLIMDN